MPLQPAILGTARLNNFRLGYVPAALAAVRAARVSILIAGVDARTRVRVQGLSIHDAINDEPNTCRLVVDGTAPLVGQDLRVSINTDTPRLLFNGTIQTVDASYEGQPSQLAWACAAVDDLVRLNRRRPFGAWTDVSATTIAQELVADFAPGFTVVNVAAGLPAVSIIFDGLDPFSRCFARLADAIGGYFYVEDLDVHLFLEETTALPAPIDHTPDRFLHEPPITIKTDDSQVRTRVYGKGTGQNLISDVPAGATLLPMADVAVFNPLGGQVIAGTTPDGAQSQILSYSGVQVGGGGSLVGPGAGPTSAPVLALAAGSGVTAGSHDVAVVFVTAAGKSIAGPRATIVAGVTLPPATAPLAGPPQNGPGPDDGTHYYAMTEVTAAGETTASPVSGTVTTAHIAARTIAAPASGPSGANDPNSTDATSVYAPGDSVYAVCTYRNAAGETTAGPASNTVVAIASFANARFIYFSGVPVPSDGAVTAKRIYFNVNGSWIGYYNIGLPNTTAVLGSTPAAGSPPGSNTAIVPASYSRIVPLSNLAPASPLGTSRNLYGTAAGGVQLKLVAALNTTDTTYNVTTPDSGLGANVPVTNTAAAGQITTSAPLGPATVTGREFYMSLAGGGARKLALTISNNTDVTGTITASDATLTAAAAEPSSDTSGLAQPAGQVLAGATSIPVAGLGGVNGFQATGGAAIVGNGSVVVRYTGITGNTLTGIPSTGDGSITATIPYNSQITAAPALTLGARIVSQELGPYGISFLKFRYLTGTPTDRVGQLFQTGVRAPVSTARLFLGRLGVPVGSIWVTIQAGAITSAGTVLGTSALVNAATVVDGAWAEFTFALPVTLEPGSYYLVLHGDYARSDSVLIAGYGFSTPPAAAYQYNGTTVIPAVDFVGNPMHALDYQVIATPLPVVSPMLKGAPVQIWVQRDDYTAQAALIALDLAQGRTSDGIIEHVLSDMRRVEASLIPLCDADLERFSRPIVTVTFDARDTALKSGKPIAFNLTSPAIAQTLTLMSVDISEIELAPGTLPRFHCVASSTAASLESILRRLLTRTT